AYAWRVGITGQQHLEGVGIHVEGAITQPQLERVIHDDIPGRHYRNSSSIDADRISELSTWISVVSIESDRNATGVANWNVAVTATPVVGALTNRMMPGATSDQPDICSTALR